MQSGAIDSSIKACSSLRQRSKDLWGCSFQRQKRKRKETLQLPGLLLLPLILSCCWKWRRDINAWCSTGTLPLIRVPVRCGSNKCFELKLKEEKQKSNINNEEMVFLASFCSVFFSHLNRFYQSTVHFPSFFPSFLSLCLKLPVFSDCICHCWIKEALISIFFLAQLLLLCETLSQASTNADLTRCIVYIELRRHHCHCPNEAVWMHSINGSVRVWIALCERSESVCVWLLWIVFGERVRVVCGDVWSPI